MAFARKNHWRTDCGSSKEFHVGSNYLVNATVRLENTSGKPLALPAQEWVVGTATPMGPDDNGQNEGTMWFDGANSVDRGLALFQHQHHVLCFLFQNPKNGIPRRREQCGVGCGAQPVFRADGDAERTGAASRRASGHFAAVPERRAGGECAAAAGNSDGAGLSGANAGGEFRRLSGRSFSLQGRRNIGRWRASGSNFKTAPTS